MERRKTGTACNQRPFWMAEKRPHPLLDEWGLYSRICSGLFL